MAFAGEIVSETFSLLLTAEVIDAMMISLGRVDVKNMTPHFLKSKHTVLSLSYPEPRFNVRKQNINDLECRILVLRPVYSVLCQEH